MKIIDTAGMQEIDRQAQEKYGIPQQILMENAGLKAFLSIKKIIKKEGITGKITILAGRGNNGGDGFVIARNLAVEGYDAAIILCMGSPKEGGSTAVNFSICRAMNMVIHDWKDTKGGTGKRLIESAWVIDCILGTGISGKAREPLPDIVDEIINSRAKVISIDIPSGIGDQFRSGYPAVKADYTLTMGLPKTALYLPMAREYCGKIITLSIGFPLPLIKDKAIPGELLSYGGLAGLLPPFPEGIHKNARGHVAVFAGCEGTTGAAFLASSACGRSRCGLVTLFADKKVYPVLAAKLSAVMVHSWDPKGEPEKFDDSRFQTFLIGPGWGLDPERLTWLKNLVRRGKKGVIDADGLTLLAGILKKENPDFKGNWIVTPHPGEFARLLGMDKDDLMKDPLPLLLDFSKKYRLITVLKLAVTLVGRPDGTYQVLDKRNPAMATGGSGDVLSGIIAGLLASGMSPADSAAAGVIVHSLAGKRAYKKTGGFMATDLLKPVSRIMKWMKTNPSLK
ncbi:MAG: NAD(P)H-hydrate dehydratase [Spirochaetales bacterium]|nr:NAD(P)H-hydrate dehydratase [Spirochaetales bacterium]